MKSKGEAEKKLKNIGKIFFCNVQLHNRHNHVMRNKRVSARIYQSTIKNKKKTKS